MFKHSGCSRVQAQESITSSYSSALNLQCQAINQAACDIAREVANEGDALVCGGVCQTPTYLTGKGKEDCQEEFKKQIEVFIKNDVDFLIAEVILQILWSRTP